MLPYSSQALTIVSDIRSNGDYVRDLSEFIRDHMISDGGSYAFATLWNQFGNKVDSNRSTSFAVMVPTQKLMDRLEIGGRIAKSRLDIYASDANLKMLEVLFNMSVGNVIPLKDDLSLFVENQEDHPIQLKLNASKVPILVLDVTSNTTINVTKFVQREYKGRIIYFIYITGILATNDVKDFIMN